MSKKKSLSISLPQELLKQLKAYQQQQDIDSSEDAIVAALEAFFEQAGDAYAPLDRVVQLEAQVDRLTEQIAVLQAFLMQSEAKTPAIAESQPVTTAAIGLPEESFEDSEDEPDEILYDFLEPGA